MVVVLCQDSPGRQTDQAFAKIEALLQSLHIEEGNGYCSQRFKTYGLEGLFNTREKTKLDIEAARLLVTCPFALWEEDGEVTLCYYVTMWLDIDRLSWAKRGTSSK